MVQPIPEGYPRVSPYLHIDGANAAIDFYSSVLGATERMRMPGPDGKLAHAELQLGDSVIMLADENPEMGILGPKSVGGSPVLISVYVEDVDATFDKATGQGATAISPPDTRFYGDRIALFEDPFGHHWSIATHVEDVSPEDMMKRAAEMGGG